MNQGKQELCLRRVEMQDKEQEDRGKPSDLVKIPLCPNSPQPHHKKQEEQETCKTSELACNLLLTQTSKSTDQKEEAGTKSGSLLPETQTLRHGYCLKLQRSLKSFNPETNES